MSCFGCFSSNEKKVVREANPRRAPRSVSSSLSKQSSSRRTQENNNNATVDKAPSSKDGGNNESGKKQVKVGAQIFSFEELASATKNFHKGCLIGEGGFGRVYKGVIGKIGKVAAIKQLDRSGLQGNREFLIEAMMLSLLHHEHLVNLIGYCTDGDQRLLVYEHMALGSLEDHLFDLPPFKKPLDWSTRMKIALGAAKGLEYLHYKANPPVIYRDLKSANILLDKEFKAKLSDFGLAKLGPQGDKTHVSSRVMGTYGYCAPEYLRTGQLTVKSDVYSFGVVMLEIITGRMAFDNMRPKAEQNVVNWADPMFKDQSRYRELADPLMKNNYPMKGLNQAVAVAAMCLHEDASSRPFMSDVVNTLSFLGEKAINVEEEEEEDVITSPSHNITTEETKVVRKNNNGSGHR